MLKTIKPLEVKRQIQKNLIKTKTELLLLINAKDTGLMH